MEKINHSTVVEKPKTKEVESFYSFHKEEVSRLLVLANIDTVDDIPLSELVLITQPWAKGDHHDPRFPINQSPDQIQQSMKLFHGLGIVEEIEPKGGDYDQVLILGGEQNSNHIRIDFALDLLEGERIRLSENGSLVCLGGDRMLKTRELSALGRDLDIINSNPNFNNTWSRKLLSSEMLAATNEEAAMRIALTARIGSLLLIEKHLRLNSESLLSHNLYRGVDMIPNIATVFAPKVDRPLGEPRHTTESTLLEWLKSMDPEKGSRILFVSNAPYTIRTARNFVSIISNLRPDLELDYCGAKAENDSSLSRRCYGELARLLFDDSKMNP